MRPVASCPRCGRLVDARAGEWWCLVCGTVRSSLADVSAVEMPVPRRRRDRAPATGRAWTADELAWLRENRHRYSIADLAAELGRTPNGVQNVLWKLGLSKARVRTTSAAADRTWGDVEGRAGAHWSEAEDGLLLDLASSGRLNSLSTYTISHRTVSALRARLRRLGAGSLVAADGCLSLAAVAAEYGVPLGRVERFVRSGRLRATKRGRVWRVDPADVEAVLVDLRAPRRTWRTGAPDLGDYGRRMGSRVVWDRVARKARRVPAPLPPGIPPSRVPYPPPAPRHGSPHAQTLRGAAPRAGARPRPEEAETATEH